MSLVTLYHFQYTERCWSKVENFSYPSVFKIRAEGDHFVVFTLLNEETRWSGYQVVHKVLSC